MIEAVLMDFFFQPKFCGVAGEIPHKAGWLSPNEWRNQRILFEEVSL